MQAVCTHPSSERLPWAFHLEVSSYGINRDEGREGKSPSMLERKQINFYTQQAPAKKAKRDLKKKPLFFYLINRTRGKLKLHQKLRLGIVIKEDRLFFFGNKQINRFQLW